MSNENNILNFTFYDPEGLRHPWMKKYIHGGFNGPVKSANENPGAWVTAPGFVCGQEELYRPVSQETGAILQNLQAYYQSLKNPAIPAMIIAEQMKAWLAMPADELKPKYLAFMQKIAKKQQQEGNRKNA